MTASSITILHDSNTVSKSYDKCKCIELLRLLFTLSSEIN
jgi:hypothetical protein